MGDNATNEEEMNYEDYIKIISDLKNSSVPKEKYEALMQEKQALLQNLVEGNQEEPEGETVDIKELRKQLFGEENHQSNLDYVTNVLKLRGALIAAGKPDPFLPVGYKITPTQEDIEAAQRVADVFQECIDYAEGDPDVFTNELQRRTIDTAPMMKKKIK